MIKDTLDYILIALVVTGALAVAAIVVVMLYGLSAYVHVRGFIFDVVGQRVFKGRVKKRGVEFV
jgi:uncharacterized membrane protein YGL010W